MTRRLPVLETEMKLQGEKKKKKGDDEQWNILVTHIHMTFLERWA